MGNPAELIQQRLNPSTFFQPECIKLKETSPPACKHVPGLGAQDDTRQASQVRSGLQVKVQQLHLSRNALC